MAYVAGPEYSISDSITVWKTILSSNESASGPSSGTANASIGSQINIAYDDIAALAGKIGPVDVGGYYDAEADARMVPEF